MAVPPVLSTWLDTPTLPTGADGREDRHSNFYEISDNLDPDGVTKRRSGDVGRSLAKRRTGWAVFLMLGFF